MRVVENLATALVRSGKCSVSFSAVVQHLHYYALSEFARHSQFKHVPFSHSRIQFYLFSKGLHINRRVSETEGISKIGWRSGGTMLQCATKLFNRAMPEKELMVDKACLERADVFHSPFYAIPAEVRKQKHLRKFLTVYDLIPILHPQYFDTPAPGEQHQLKGILDGIDKNDWVTCISQNTKEDLCNYRPDLDPGRISVTYLGASNWFYPCHAAAEIDRVRVKYKIPSGNFALSVCTLEPRKNLSHLIRCFLKLLLQERLPNLYLVLVGNFGWKYDSIITELAGAQESLRDRIILTGRVNDEDMAALYSGSTVFVYPSLYEGFGLPPLEAMQCGVPVITSNTSSLPEVVSKAGIMVDPQDGDALCEAMLRVVSDDDLRDVMSQKSLDQAKKFSWAQCADQTLRAYQTAVDSF